jgi:RNA polymerase sigma-54 factor
LQQSIRLLQLSTLELHQEIEQMLEQNPFLEPEDDFSPIEGATALEFERQRNEHNSSEDAGAERESSSTEADTSGIDTAEMGTTEREDWENGTEREDFDGISESPARQNQGDDEIDPLERNSLSITLQEHLRQQLLGTRLSAEDMAAVDMLIESLNEDGYLADTLEDIAASLLPDEPDEDTLDELLSRLRCALGWLQNLEPVGVGARNLSECLLLQLRGRPAEPACDVAKVICREHLELLARRDFKKLMAATGADEALLKDAQSLIVSLEPKPGRAFTRAEANIIIPDVIVQKAGRSWKVILNPDVMPKLRINDYYAQALRSSRGPRGGHGQRGARQPQRPSARGSLVRQEHHAALRHHPARVPGHRRSPEELLHPWRDRHEAAGPA